MCRIACEQQRFGKDYDRPYGRLDEANDMISTFFTLPALCGDFFWAWQDGKKGGEGGTGWLWTGGPQAAGKGFTGFALGLSFSGLYLYSDWCSVWDHLVRMVQ